MTLISLSLIKQDTDLATQDDLKALRDEIESIRIELNQRNEAAQWPVLISRPDLARLCGLSGNSVRKREYQETLPGGGKFDVVVCGVRMWRRSTVESWLHGISEDTEK